MGSDLPNPIAAGFSRTASFAARHQSDQQQSSFNSGALLAEILEMQMHPGQAHENRLGTILQQEPMDLREGVNRLSSADQALLRQRVPPQVLEQIYSLSHETNAEMFFSQLTHLGLSLSQSGQGEMSVLILQTVGQALNRDFPGRPENHAELALGAQQELDAILGRGDSGRRFEFLARGFAEQTAHPVGLASMVLAGFAFNTVRTGALARLLSARAGFFTQGLAAEGLAALIGTAAEIPTFVFSGRGLNEALGVRQDWSSGAIWHDLASNALVLSALKLSGYGARRMLGAGEAVPSLHTTAFQRFSEAAIPQVAMFGGILAGHALETQFGLRQPVDGSTTLTDSLVTLFQFNMAGKITEGVMGPRYARFNEELELRSRALASQRGPWGPHGPRGELLNWVQNLLPNRPSAATLAGDGPRELFPIVVLNESHGDGDSKGPPSTQSPVVEGGRPTPRPPAKISEKADSVEPQRIPLAELAKIAAAADAEEGERPPTPTPPTPAPQTQTSGADRPTRIYVPARDQLGRLHEAREEEEIAMGETVMSAVVPPPARLPSESELLGQADTSPSIVPPAAERAGPETLESVGSVKVLVNAPAYQGETLAADPEAVAAAAGPSPQVRTGPSSPKANLYFSPGARIAVDKFNPEGRFQVIRHLGSGGFGDVYQVENTRLRSPAVVKVPRDLHSLSERAYDILIERNRLEAMIGANLVKIRGAVAVYDLIQHEGYELPVMQYVEGKDLNVILEEIRDGNPDTLATFTPIRRLELIAEVARILEGVHDEFILHRDIKPRNIRIATNGEEFLMDFGIAKPIHEIMKQKNGDTVAPESPNNGGVSPSISPQARADMPQDLTVDGGAIPGTPAYMSPDRMLGKPLENPFRDDLYAMGMSLYETMFGAHPLSQFRPPSAAQRERADADQMQLPKLMPLRDRHKQTQFLPPHIVISSLLNGKTLPIPSYQDIMVGNQPAYFDQVEIVARRAIGLEPEKYPPFDSMQEFRQELLLAPARARLTELEALRIDREQTEEKMVKAWEKFNSGIYITPESWAELNNPIEDLINKRDAWRNGVRVLIRDVERIMGNQNWPQGQQIIASLSWQRLVDGGDRMGQGTREELIEAIKTNNVPTPQDPIGEMRLSLEKGTAFHLNLHEIHSLKPIRDGLKLRIFPVEREIDLEGHELRNFREGEGVEVSLNASLESMFLKSGYYVFEFEHPDYAPMRVPTIISLDDVRKSIREEIPLNLEFEFVPRELVAPGMVVIHKGEATIGHDFYHDGPPDSVYSVPRRKVLFPTFAISRDPIMVKEYMEFIEDQLARGNDEARHYAPRIKIKPRDEIFEPTGTTAVDRSERQAKGILQEFMKLRREHGVNEAINLIKMRFTGTVYFWKFRHSGRGKNRRYFLENPLTNVSDPKSHRDPLGDPIFPDQPIGNLDFNSVAEFVKWRSERDKIAFRIPSPDEKEKVDRSSFPQKYPWGDSFNPNYLNSRNLHEKDEDRYIRPVGTHIHGPELYRDKSYYGTRDNIGNVREFTLSPNLPPHLISLSGGSAFVPFGPYFLPSSRASFQKGDVDLGSGAFRLVQDFPLDLKKL